MFRIASMLILTLVLAAPAQAGFEEGLAAADRGDYATALRELRPLAEQGFANAQANLGFMYAYGRGVPESLVHAFAWWNLAAGQGVKRAAQNMDIARNRMTAEQIAQAQRLSQELVAKTPTRWQGKTASPPSKPTNPPANSGLVRDVQLALSNKGFDPGPVDGKPGKKTRAAVRAFQRSIGLPESGKISPELLLLLRN